jgi:hypothetical protein
MNNVISFFRLLIVVLFVGVGNVFPSDLDLAQPNETQKSRVVTQRLFTSPDEAAKALQAATAAKDKIVLSEIFGPEVKELLTGDEVQDANNARKFAAVLAQGYTLAKEGEDTITIEAGPNKWPMPIPLVKVKRTMVFQYRGRQRGDHQSPHRERRTPRRWRLPRLCDGPTAIRKHEPGRESRREVRAEIQKHARENGWPLLDVGGKRKGRSVRAFSGGSQCRGLYREQGSGTETVSRLLF